MCIAEAFNEVAFPMPIILEKASVPFQQKRGFLGFLCLSSCALAAFAAIIHAANHGIDSVNCVEKEEENPDIFESTFFHCGMPSGI